MKPSMACQWLLWSRRRVEPAKAAGIAPRLEPAGKRGRPWPQPRPETGFLKRLRPWKWLREIGETFGPSRDPKGGFERLRPGGIPRKAKASAGVFRKGDRRGLGLDASLGKGAASAAPDPTGIGEGPKRLSPGPTGSRTRLRGLAPGSEESEAGVRARLAIRKPPSERWPRHPATAVKAGTSGGRWRHRPPL
jgi:hypothetical protein